MDLFPTVADLVGVPDLPAHDGNSFAPLLFDSTARSRSFVLSHTASLHPKRFLPSLALWADGLKYIHTSGHQGELYDLRRDPGEQKNLATEDAVLAGYLRQRLRALASFDIDMGLETTSSGTQLDEESIEQMQALGYGR
jgi:arylsulfatase A-like enzyme